MIGQIFSFCTAFQEESPNEHAAGRNPPAIALRKRRHGGISPARLRCRAGGYCPRLLILLPTKKDMRGKAQPVSWRESRSTQPIRPRTPYGATRRKAQHNYLFA